MLLRLKSALESQEESLTICALLIMMPGLGHFPMHSAHQLAHEQTATWMGEMCSTVLKYCACMLTSMNGLSNEPLSSFKNLT